MTPKQAQNDKAVSEFRQNYQKTVDQAKDAVNDSGILDIMPANDVQKLIKRVAGIDL